MRLTPPFTLSLSKGTSIRPPFTLSLSKGAATRSVFARLRLNGGAFWAGLLTLISACAPTAQPCGPKTGVVMRVSDGDTFVLESGEKVRMLMVDTPEVGDNAECFGPEASAHTKSLLTGKTVTLQYDASCTDRFGRLLAYVFVDGQEINTQLVEQGFACVLHISPNGDDRVEEFDALEESARQGANGLWAVCAKKPC